MTDHQLHANRRAQDGVLAARHRGFDLAAKDQTMKYERSSFSVVGEGSRQALSRYATNYDLIDWRA